jgi:hypothetical protein
MTEAEWMACTDPEPLLEFLHNQTIEERKYRLFACACCRRIWHLLDGRSQRLIEVVERYMAGLSDAAALAAAAEHHGDVLREATPYTPAHVIAPIVHMTRPGVGAAWALAWNTVSETRRALRLHSPREDPYRGYRECQVQATILREVIGNPFRSLSVDPSIRRWNDETPARLAHAIYDEQAFDRLPILADALEEAGCTDQDILNHCRKPGDHIRGCWVVDALLGKS